MHVNRISLVITKNSMESKRDLVTSHCSFLRKLFFQFWITITVQKKYLACCSIAVNDEFLDAARTV